jgi:hypothetical protein
VFRCPYTDDVFKMIDTLASVLERPRELSNKVVNYIGDTYAVDYDNVGRFLVAQLPELEDYELDLILSPLFTPTLSDQSIFAELLGRDSVARPQWPELVHQLVSRPTRAQLVTSDGQAHAVPLREVTIERYVYRLRLDASMPQSLFELIEQTVPVADRPMLKAVARRPLWENEGRSNILERYLSAVAGQGSYRLDDALELLNVIENYKPADVADLRARIPARLEALRGELNSPKPFFSQRVQDLHGGDRDQRGHDDPRRFAKENELAFLERLQVLLE